MIRPCNDTDLDTIFVIINEAAQAYCGVIPADLPGMSLICPENTFGMKSTAACGSGDAIRTASWSASWAFRTFRT